MLPDGLTRVTGNLRRVSLSLLCPRSVRAVAMHHGFLLFVGHHSILAWGATGQAMESGKLSDEGVTISCVEDGVLRG